MTFSTVSIVERTKEDMSAIVRLKYVSSETRISRNKFLDVLWFLNIYYYKLSTACLQSSMGGLQ